eukprot:gene7325-8106_t
MERLLGEIGVAEDTEEDVLTRLLSSAGLPAISSSPKQPSMRGLAQSIIDNELPSNLSNNEINGGELGALSSLSSGKGKRTRSILLPAEWKTKKEQESSTKKPVQHLNKLIFQAMKRTDISVSEVDAEGADSHSSDSAERVPSATKMKRKGEKRSSQETNKHQEVVVCPVCGRDFSVDGGEAASFLSRHMTRCERRRTCSKSSNMYVDESIDETDLLGDDIEEDELFEIRKSNKRLKKASLQSVSLKDELEQDIDIGDIEAEAVAMVGSDTNCKDDWEEVDYRARMSRLSADDLEVVDTPFGARMYARTWECLHDYQKKGCEWLNGLYREGCGGILADEMGLGKTAQVCAHFGSLGKLSSQLYKVGSAAFLIICPATVLQHWLNELHRWAPGLRVGVLHSISSTGRQLVALKASQLETVLKKLRRDRNKSSGIAIVTTYDNLRRHRAVLAAVEWTAVCLDEGQKIRNPDTVISAICKDLPAYHRLILSGTPIQNSLKELWNLFDFIYPGRLGSLPVFELELATPIRLGGYANASKLQRKVAIECAIALQRIVQPYLLRRKKKDIMATLSNNMPKKVEHILLCSISQLQRSIYLEILRSDEVRNALDKKVPVFRAINTLRKLCNHPALVYQNGRILWQQDKDFVRFLAAPANLYQTLGDLPDEEVSFEGLLEKSGSGGLRWADSGKLLVLSKILPLWKEEGHKVLIFCQTTSMLGIIESMVREMKFSFLRLDGQTPVARRASLIDQFNSQAGIFVMILTTRTGGLGISLTAANRVILFDPDWNPMTDIQARERAYRLGQQRDVVIYRLLTRGTIEEKIYHRQIFKLLLSSRILENPKEKALFSKSELRELFELTDGCGDGGSSGDQSDALPMQSKVDLDDKSPQEEKAMFSIEEVQEERGDGADDERMLDAQEGSETAEFAQDRKLLRALFAGDVITSVYNHDYLEPGAGKGDDLQRDAQAIVKRAVSALQPLEKGEATSRPSRDSSSSEPLEKNRFAAVSTSTDPANSSVSLLALLRGRQQRVEDKTDEPARSAMREEIPSSSSSSSFPPPNQSSNSVTSSIEQVIRDRLLRLFRLQRSEGRGVRGSPSLSSKDILHNFRDLGDQYAPLLKALLRGVATFREGIWTLKAGVD